MARKETPKIQEVVLEAGNIYKTNFCGDIQIVSAKNNKKVVIKFMNTGNIKTTQKHQIEKGLVKDIRLVYGVGIYIRGKYKAHENGKETKEYSLWSGMLGRCYSDKHHKKYPTYIGCEVSENFKDFQYFAEWCQGQVGFGVDGYQLDKDFLSNGCKIYSETTCVFIPCDLNNFLTHIKRNSSSLPVGVSVTGNGSFQAYCQQGSRNVFLGTFDTLDCAMNAYSEVKERVAKELSIKYKNLVDDRIVKALESFKVY